MSFNKIYFIKKVFITNNYLPFHLALRTTPNWPDPNSSISVSSVGSTSHFPWDRPAVGGFDRPGGHLSLQARPPAASIKKFYGLTG